MSISEVKTCAMPIARAGVRAERDAVAGALLFLVELQPRAVLAIVGDAEFGELGDALIVGVAVLAVLLLLALLLLGVLLQLPRQFDDDLIRRAESRDERVDHAAQLIEADVHGRVHDPAPERRLVVAVLFLHRSGQDVALQDLPVVGQAVEQLAVALVRVMPGRLAILTGAQHRLVVGQQAAVRVALILERVENCGVGGGAEPRIAVGERNGRAFARGLLAEPILAHQAGDQRLLVRLVEQLGDEGVLLLPTTACASAGRND